MPQTTARVFARLMDWADPSGTPTNGVELVRLEWSLLEGTRNKGKDIFTVTMTTKTHLASDITEALVSVLNNKFPTANFSEQDIILWGA
jgi:hypothetical protein